jgi:hypothetical protein
MFFGVISAAAFRDLLAPPAIAQSHRDRALGRVLPHDACRAR